MKYLKRFLITERVDLNELQNFCDNTLAYLIDEGFKVDVKRYFANRFQSGYIEILLRKPDDFIFYWSHYKDDIIPFIEYLYDKYNCEERISIIDRFNSSTQLKIANPKLGYHNNKTEIIKDLDSIKIDYPLSGIFFYINIE